MHRCCEADRRHALFEGRRPAGARRVIIGLPDLSPRDSLLFHLLLRVQRHHGEVINADFAADHRVVGHIIVDFAGQCGVADR